MRWHVVGVSFALLLTLFVYSGGATSSGRVVAYHDAEGGLPDSADITGVTVDDERGSVVFRIQIDRLVALPDDLGIEIAVDTDRNPSSGFPWYVHAVGAEYTAQILGGVPRLLRWDGAFRRWRTQDRPRVSVRPGEVVVAFRIVTHGAFDFVVSTATNMIPQPDGSFIISDSVYDFAPSHGHWRYRPVSG